MAYAYIWKVNTVGFEHNTIFLYSSRAPLFRVIYNEIWFYDEYLGMSQYVNLGTSPEAQQGLPFIYIFNKPPSRSNFHAKAGLVANLPCDAGDFV